MNVTRVLAVEDDKYISGAYKAKFETAGFKSKFAYDGKEALMLLKTFIPDVIILDLVMPRGDGFELLKQLQKNKKWSEIPVIIASNLEEEGFVQKARSFRANEYVFKSGLSLADLVNRINEIKTERISKQ